MNALIIENDPEERAFMRRGLTSIGYSCETVADGKEGLDRLLNRTYDLATVDLMLPGMDGKEIIREVRDAGVKTHIITPHISRIRRKLVLEGESDPLDSKRNEGCVFH